ncbi:MAG: DUF6178 family protein [Myxococcota bacterium]|nr:DUF6178 family protein [Myxococcota bacterium]
MSNASGNDIKASENAPRLRVEQPQEFAPWLAQLNGARGGQDLLDRIISPSNSSELVKALPVDDLYAHIQKIGLDDSELILAMASGEQIRGLIDSDAWARDELQLQRLDPWLKTLMRGGPEVLGPRILDLDDSMITQVLRSSVDVIIVDDPDSFEAPDVEHVRTPDGQLCVCFPRSEARDLPVKIFLDWLMRTNPAYCINLLVFSTASLPSTLQEDAYRWRTARMADRGYVDYYDALSIYVPLPVDTPGLVERPPEHPEITGGHWLSSSIEGHERLHAAFQMLSADDRSNFQARLALAANMALSADRVELWDETRFAETLHRVRACLVLGIDAIGGRSTASNDAKLLRTVETPALVRIGYGRLVEAASALTKAKRHQYLAGPNGPLDGVDIMHLRAWAEKLAQRHPGSPADDAPSTADALNTMTLNARIIADLGHATHRSRPIDIGIGAWTMAQLMRALLGIEGTGPLPSDRLADAHAELFHNGSIQETVRMGAQSWWKAQGGSLVDAIDTVLDDACSQIGQVDPSALEPKFAPCIWTDLI